MTLSSQCRRLFRTAHSIAISSSFRRTPTHPHSHLPSLLQSSPLQFVTTSARMSSSMAARLAGKTILITGASSGIGRSCAFEFARTSPEDLKLVLTARRIDTLKEVAEEIGKFAPGVKVLPVKLDVSKAEEIEGLVGGLPEEFRQVDVLVNNAYVSIPISLSSSELMSSTSFPYNLSHFKCIALRA